MGRRKSEKRNDNCVVTFFLFILLKIKAPTLETECFTTGSPS